MALPSEDADPRPLCWLKTITFILLDHTFTTYLSTFPAQTYRNGQFRHVKAHFKHMLNINYQRIINLTFAPFNTN